MTTNSRRLTTIAASAMLVVGLLCGFSVAFSAPPSTADDKESAKTPPANEVADQIKELQTKLADLKKQMSELQSPRIVAAGTATWTRPRELANNTSTRVKLGREITAQLGKDYIVLLTNRSPVGGYPWLDCYWKIADDGFDITLVDSSLASLQTASYDNKNMSYLVDWVVVKK